MAENTESSKSPKDFIKALKTTLADKDNTEEDETEAEETADIEGAIADMVYKQNSSDSPDADADADAPETQNDETEESTKPATIVSTQSFDLTQPSPPMVSP